MTNTRPPRYDHPYLDPREKVTSNPTVENGAPIVLGTRVTVVSVLAAVKVGDSRLDIAKRFSITKEDIMACVTYSRKHWPHFFVVFILATRPQFSNIVDCAREEKSL